MNQFTNICLTYINFFPVSGGPADNDPVRGDCGDDHDDREPHLHPQPAVQPLGGLLHRLHRAGRPRLHDLLGSQPRLHIHDQPHHVHWVSSSSKI